MLSDKIKNKQIYCVCEMFMGIPEFMLAADVNGKLVFASPYFEKQIREVNEGEAISNIFGVDIATQLLNSFSQFLPIAIPAMLNKRVCTLSMTPYDGYMVIIARYSPDQQSAPILNKLPMKFIEKQITNTISLMFMSVDSVKHALGEAVDKVEYPMSVIRQSAFKLLRLSSSFFDCSKFDENQMKLNLSGGDFTAFFKSTCESVKPFFEDLNIKFTVNTPDYAILTSFDYAKCEKMVFNALANCCKQAKGGTVDISLTTDKKNISIQIISKVKEKSKSRFTKISENPDYSAALYAGLELPLAGAFAALHKGSLKTMQDHINGEEVNTLLITIPIRSPRNMFRQPMPEYIDKDINALVHFADIISSDFFK